MPGGALFEVVLVVLFVFVTMSAIVSSAQELLFQVMGWRSHKLRKSVQKMLDDSEYGKEISKRLYRHPLVTGEEKSRKHITNIEPKAFALALANAVQPAGANSEPLSDLPNSIDSLREGDLKRRLQMVLPPATAEHKREDIEAAVMEWYNTATNKNIESYKADAKAASYFIAAVATVTLNVSPIEIAQRLTQDDALRTTFASAVPDLAPMLYNPGQGLPVAPPAGATAGLSSETDGANSPTSANNMKTEDINQMLSFYQCAESRLSLPIGWAWMSGVVDAAKNSKVGNSLLGADQQTCQRALGLASASGDPALKASLAKLNASGATNFKKEYGPSFETDNPFLIFAGWLITVIAAGQGAPFWFNLLQRFIKK
jgi:hypothetical protein